MDEAMAEHNSFLAARGFSSSSAPRHSSTTGSILDILEDIRSGNTVPLASPTGSVESDTPAGILRIKDQAWGLEGIESIMAIGGRFHMLERAVRALTALVGQQGDEIIALQDKLSSHRHRFPPPSSSSTPTSTSTQTLSTEGSGGDESIEEVAREAPATKPSFSEVVQRLGYVQEPKPVKGTIQRTKLPTILPTTTQTAEASSSSSDGGVSMTVVKDKRVHWERDRKRRRPSGAERRRRKRAAQEEAIDSDSATPAKTQGKPRLVQVRPKGQAPATDKGAEQTADHPVAPCAAAVPTGPAAATAGAWNVVTPRRTVQKTPLGHTSPQNTAPPPPSSSPTPNARSRHITMRFATRKEVNLPEGVTVEGIRNWINITLFGQGKIRG